MVEAFDAAVVDVDVVHRPQCSERLAPGRELADEVGQVAVGGVAAGLGVQRTDDVACDALPVWKERRCARIEEDEAGGVHRPSRIGVQVREESLPEPVGGEDIAAAVAHVCRDGAHRVEDALHVCAHLLPRPPATLLRRRVLRAGEIEEMRTLRVVELKRARERLENGLGNAGRVASLELRVVGDADTGEQRDLLPPQPGNPAGPGAVGAQPSLLRGDPSAPRGQELAHLAPGVHLGTVAPPDFG